MKPYQPERFPFSTDWLLFEDAHIIVANKPSGLLSVPGRTPENKTCLISHLEAHCRHPLHVVHRLDMDTSGIMIIAKHKEALRHLNKQFQNRQTYKRYQALCTGILEQEYGHIHLPMRCDWENRPRQIIDFLQGKHTHTEWQKVQQFSDSCLIDLIPHTGRSHQLRVHMQMLGHPILGDTLYADNTTQNSSSRLFLHATELHFIHPITHSKMQIHTPSSFQ